MKACGQREKGALGSTQEHRPGVRGVDPWGSDGQGRRWILSLSGEGAWLGF